MINVSWVKNNFYSYKEDMNYEIYVQLWLNIYLCYFILEFIIIELLYYTHRTIIELSY